MLCLCLGLELHTTIESCAEEDVEEVAPLQPASPVFFYNRKVVWGSGRERYGFAVDVPDALGLSSSSIFERCGKYFC